MMNTLDSHKLALGTFISLAIPPFAPPEDRTRLSRVGFWLLSLEQGRLPPITERQRRFVAVTKGERSSESDWEYLWLQVMKFRVAKRDRVCICPDFRVVDDLKYESGWNRRTGGGRMCIHCGELPGPMPEDWLRSARSLGAEILNAAKLA